MLIKFPSHFGTQIGRFLAVGFFVTGCLFALTGNMLAADSTVVFARDGSIYLTEPNGTPVLILNSQNEFYFHSPSLSPDKQRIAVVKRSSNEEGNSISQVHVMNVDGSNLQNITPSFAWATDADWSPNSDKLVFVGNCDPTFAGNANFNCNNESFLYAVNDYQSSSVTMLAQTGGATDPTWSPSGTKIAFAYNKDADSYGIYTIDATGGNFARITQDNIPVADPAISPNGLKVVYARNYPIRADMIIEGGTKHTGLPDLQFANGGEIVTQTIVGIGSLNLRIPNNGSEPAWSPDGTQILFAYSPSGFNRDLYVFNAAGTLNLTPFIATANNQETSASWR